MRRATGGAATTSTRADDKEIDPKTGEPLIGVFL
jgi:hypothetical protein